MSGRIEIYRQLRNFLAGQQVGATHDEALFRIALKALLCSSYIEAGRAQGPTIAAAYEAAWTAVRSDFPDWFKRTEVFELSQPDIEFVHGLVSQIDLHSADYDPFGDLYEVFAAGSFRGQAGQFFTPQNAVNLLIEMVEPGPQETVVDPACGAGGFLSAVVLRRIAAGQQPAQALQGVIGIDKDEYLARLAAARLGLIGASDPQILNADSIAWSTPAVGAMPELGLADVVLTNPPFGAKIVAASKETQARFDLGYSWKQDATGVFVQTGRLQSSVPPQALFIERILSLLRPGGRMGLVVPESLLSSRGHRYVVEYLRQRATIDAVVGMPENLFKSGGSGGTHTKTCLLVATKNPSNRGPEVSPVFMAEVKWCGNDSRGRRVFPDELPTVAERWASRSDTLLQVSDHLGYVVPGDSVVDGILAPRYYNPEVARELSRLEKTHDLISVGQLIAEGLISISSGDEIGKSSYGTGDIPFVRTSDISNWEVKVDPKHGVSNDVYESYRRKQDVREGDILMVRDGTYLIGTCAILTAYDTRIVYQSHLLKIRSMDHGKLDPFLLLAAFSSAPVRTQILAKRFTQDIIDTLGNRLTEIMLPIPKSANLRNRVAETVRKAVADRIEARELSRQAVLDLVGYES